MAAAAALLADVGRDGVTTRAVSARAGVQDPAIYRLFGDKRGLLDAVSIYGIEKYLANKTALPPIDDPVDALRAGWDLHVEFGLANPALYALIYGDPRPGVASPAADAALAMLHHHIRRIAAAGRLTVEEARAAELVHAAGSGTTLALLATPVGHRDSALSDLAREAVIAAITTAPGRQTVSEARSAAVALRANISDVSVLSVGETALLSEWLDRIAAG